LKIALGILETTGLTPAVVALDAMEKSSTVRLFQAEVNDLLGVCLKIIGPQASVRDAIEVGRTIAQQMGGSAVADVINSVDPEAWKAIESPAEYNPLIQQNVVWTLTHLTSSNSISNETEASIVTDSSAFALGFIETQGFTAVFEAIDTACKAANVEVVAKEKLGGGYVTIVVKGDVAAVNAAIDAGKRKVEGLGKLIAAHVIPRPSANVVALLTPIAK
jgi:microcompartment protein CcmL/EutN